MPFSSNSTGQVKKLEPVASATGFSFGMQTLEQGLSLRLET
jgi:hypothetical protein